MPDSPVPVTAPPPPAPTGGLLSGSPLRAALFDGERIFRAGSAAEGQVRGAGYELRLAGDRMVLPVKPGSAEFESRDDPQRELSEITLAPGDSALVFSAERFSMDFDVTCLIGPKFRWAVRGLLVLQGMAAHPGYGREFRHGQWLPKDDERLSLVVANIGPHPINMRRGDPIAYVQFFEVERPDVPKETRNVGYEELRGAFDAGGLAYFKNVRDISARVDAAEEAAGKRVSQALAAHGAEMSATLSAHRAEMAKLQERVDASAKDIDQVRNSTLNVVIFGVFLVAVTLLGIVVSTLSGMVERLPDKMSGGRELWIGSLCVFYVLAAAWGVWSVVKHVNPPPPKAKPQSGKNAAG